MKQMNWELKNAKFDDRTANAQRMSIQQKVLMLEGGSIFSSSLKDK
jgi:hypothetical protein